MALRPSMAEEEAWIAAKSASHPLPWVSWPVLPLGVLAAIPMGWAGSTVDMGSRGDSPQDSAANALWDFFGNIVVFFGVIGTVLGLAAIAVFYNPLSRRSALAHFGLVLGGAGFFYWALYGFFDYIDEDAGSLAPGLIIAGVLSGLRWLCIEVGRPQNKAHSDALHEALQGLREPLMSARDTVRGEIWGTPGQGDDATAKFGAANTALGVYGEKYVAEVLERFAAQDKTTLRVFHQIKFPGSQNADIDHVIVRGSKSVLVDAKAWKLGHYSWHHDGTLLRDGAPFEGNVTHMPTASAMTAKSVPPGSAFPVCYIVLVPPRGSSKVATVDNTMAPPGIALATPEQVKTWLGEYLMTEDSAYLDRRLLGFWRDRLK